MDLTFTASGGFDVTVSPEDADLADRYWHLAGSKGIIGKYAASGGKNTAGKPTTVYLHRIVAQRMGLVPDIPPAVGTQGAWRLSIDHINGDKLDNRRENLRVRTRKQQMANTNDGLRTNNRSGHRGVSFIAKEAAHGRRPWYAYVQVDHRSKSLGRYATVGEAAAARRAWDEAHPD